VPTFDWERDLGTSSSTKTTPESSAGDSAALTVVSVLLAITCIAIIVAGIVAYVMLQRRNTPLKARSNHVELRDDANASLADDDDEETPVRARVPPVPASSIRETASARARRGHSRHSGRRNSATVKA